MVDGELYAYGNTRTGSDSPDSARKGMGFALEKSGMKIENIDYCIGTGYGRSMSPIGSAVHYGELLSCERSKLHVWSQKSGTVMDMGGQDCKVINIDDRARFSNFYDE